MPELAQMPPCPGLGGALFRSCRREFEFFRASLSLHTEQLPLLSGVVGAEFGRDPEKAEEVTDFGFGEKIGYADWAGLSGVLGVGLG